MTALTEGAVAGAVIIGLGATLAMDLWNLFLKHAFTIPSLDYCMLGRWVGHIPRGRLRHAGIGASPVVPYECAIGWVTHYSIGAVLAVGFVCLSSAEWLRRPTLPPALLYGLVTVAFPFFVLQPALGLGLASSKAPSPVQARIKSLATHIVFGLGLYLGALALRRVFQAGA